MSTIRDRIIAALRDTPHARNVDIAKALDVQPAYVSVVRRRHGFPFRKRGGNTTIRLTNINSDWIVRTAKAENLIPEQLETIHD